MSEKKYFHRRLLLQFYLYQECKCNVMCFKELYQFQGRRHSPSPARLTPEPSVEKDEGISDEEDPAELRILLELNEQVSFYILIHS